MQNKIAKMQQEMAERTVEASSGGGMVKVVATCKQDIVSITIDPKALEGGDVEMLQDLILSAVNEGVRVTRSNMEREMSNLTGGIRVPGMFKSISPLKIFPESRAASRPCARFRIGRRVPASGASGVRLTEKEG